MSEHAPHHGKIFCIGFHKTGTSSLAAALKMLGYTVSDHELRRDFKLGRRSEPISHDLLVKLCLEEAKKWDAVQDNPWPLVFRELDTAFPGAKFIHTERPSERWIASVTKHFGERTTPMREYIYGPGHGAPVGNEAVYLARYAEHNAAVRDYFKDRPSDLLILDVTRPGQWEALCPFLGRPVPDEPFPARNTSAKREAKARNRLGTWLGSLFGKR